MPLYRIPGTSELVSEPTASAHPTTPEPAPAHSARPQAPSRHVIGLNHSLPVPGAAYIVARFREAFTSISGYVFGWNARAPKHAVTYVAMHRPGAQLGAHGNIFVATILELQLGEREQLSVLVNVGLHELGHRLGLPHTHDPANVMFDIDGANASDLRQLDRRKTFNAGQIVQLKDLAARG